MNECCDLCGDKDLPLCRYSYQCCNRGPIGNMILCPQCAVDQGFIEKIEDIGRIAEYKRELIRKGY